MKLKIGMRNIKTAISVFICVVISKIFRLEYSFYASIAAIITMENSLVSSYKVGKNRMMGTLVGATIGLIFASIHPNNAILCGIGIVILIYICNLLKWNKSITIAGVVFMAIMVNMNGKNPMQYSINRIIDTFIGITVALLVNYFFMPNDIHNKLMKDFEFFHDEITSIINQTINLDIKIDLNNINNKILDFKKSLQICITELRFKKDDEEKFNSIKRRLELYSDIYEHLNIIQRLGAGRSLDDNNIVRLKNLNYPNTKPNTYSHEDLDVVYNYHVGSIIEDIIAIETNI